MSPASPANPANPAGPANPASAAARPGLARERTSLAWSRTALSYAACVLLLARLATTAGATATAAVGAVGVLVTVALLAAGELRYRSSAATPVLTMPAPHPGLAVRPVVGPVSVALLATGSVLLGVCALILILA